MWGKNIVVTYPAYLSVGHYSRPHQIPKGMYAVVNSYHDSSPSRVYNIDIPYHRWGADQGNNDEVLNGKFFSSRQAALKAIKFVEKQDGTFTPQMLAELETFLNSIQHPFLSGYSRGIFSDVKMENDGTLIVLTTRAHAHNTDDAAPEDISNARDLILKLRARFGDKYKFSREVIDEWVDVNIRVNTLHGLKWIVPPKEFTDYNAE